MIDEPIDRVAFTNLVARAHSALRGIDASDTTKPPTQRELDAVSDAIAALEEFTRERGISLEWTL